MFTAVLSAHIVIVYPFSNVLKLYVVRVVHILGNYHKCVCMRLCDSLVSGMQMIRIHNIPIAVYVCGMFHVRPFLMRNSLHKYLDSGYIAHHTNECTSPHS